VYKKRPSRLTQQPMEMRRQRCRTTVCKRKEANSVSCFQHICILIVNQVSIINKSKCIMKIITTRNCLHLAIKSPICFSNLTNQLILVLTRQPILMKECQLTHLASKFCSILVGRKASVLESSQNKKSSQLSTCQDNIDWV